MFEAVLLGVAQDAGVPQAGCDCTTCSEARADDAQRQRVVCLGLIDHESRAFWLIDATPDFREQYDRLRRRATGCAFAGILLTHAHIGHYAGLVFVGKESMNTRGLQVYCSASMRRFLAHSAPWSALIAQGNISPAAIPTYPLEAVAAAGTDRVSPSIVLGGGLRVWAIGVPHRNESSDTVAYLIQGRRSRLLYLPDIDGWDAWTSDLSGGLAQLGVAVALLDGCFYSADELPRMAQVPHPPVSDTLERLHDRCVGREIVFVHLNHTNPLLREGAERQALRRAGMAVGVEGVAWTL